MAITTLQFSTKTLKNVIKIANNNSSLLEPKIRNLLIQSRKITPKASKLFCSRKYAFKCYVAQCGLSYITDLSTLKKRPPLGKIIFTPIRKNFVLIIFARTRKTRRARFVATCSSIGILAFDSLKMIIKINGCLNVVVTGITTVLEAQILNKCKNDLFRDKLYKAVVTTEFGCWLLQN